MGFLIGTGLASGARPEAPSERQNRVIFLSDGNATAGDTSQGHIMQMAKGRVQRGIGLTAIGVGVDFDVGLMRGLAEQGAGHFYFLENPTAATEVFTEDLDFSGHERAGRRARALAFGAIRAGRRRPSGLPSGR
jgi:secreted protein with Ig-like and vWFA domain